MWMVELVECCGGGGGGEGGGMLEDLCPPLPPPPPPPPVYKQAPKFINPNKLTSQRILQRINTKRICFPQTNKAA